MEAETMSKYLERQRWFIDRIGKRIFREPSTCKCKTCASVVENGLIIKDELHATYLHEIENEYGREGHDLKYRDIK